MIVSVASSEAIVLLLLWMALAWRAMSRFVRPLVALLGVSCAWGAWVLVLVVRGPWWMTGLTAGFIVLSSASLGVAIHLATRDEPADAGGADAGGGPGLCPADPGGGGGDAQPVWWPAFERQFARYTEERERTGRSRQPVEC